jgi:uncharacterized protein YjbI with pentapeptide repeats
MTETTQAARQVQIVSRWNSSRVLFSFDVPATVASGMETRAALESAVAGGANLRGADLSDADLSDANLRGADLSDADLSDANLRGADLRGANLRDADLSGADLRGANLSDANLRGADLRDADLRDANLRGADLRGANLSDANLRGADLRDADLRDADLRGADLRGADLRDADLRGADLRDANLSPIKADYFDVLLRAPREIPALRAALVAGKVDGSCYEGACACLVGTIANARGAQYDALGSGLAPNSSRPIESFFMSITSGDTPETNQVSKLAVEWLDEFAGLLSAAA